MSNRGFLRNFPADVVARVNTNGTWWSITRTDILNNKRARQRRELSAKRNISADVISPCFVWTFYNPHFPYMGWHLYVRTLRRLWWIRSGRGNNDIILQIMKLYPCGLLPMLENLRVWKAAFAEWYPKATEKRSGMQGMVVARAVVSSGQLLDVMRVE